AQSLSTSGSCLGLPCPLCAKSGHSLIGKHINSRVRADWPCSCFRQPCFLQAFEEPFPISWSCERPPKPLIAYGQSWHTMQQLIQRGASSCSIPQMSIGRSQDRVNVGKFGIGFASVLRELDRLIVPLGRQCRPAFGNMPDDQQQASRAEADRLLQMRHGGLIIAAESITYAQIAAGELRGGIEIKGTVEAGWSLFVMTGK